MFKVTVFLFFALISGLICEKDHAITKRALLFPRATVLQFTYGVSFPAILPRRTINLSLCLQVNYNLPYNISNFQPMVVQAKSSKDFDLSRESLYKYAIEFLDSFGMDGEECLLRLICEISKIPMHLEQKESLLEEIAHFLFTPSLDVARNNLTDSFENRLLDAEDLGARRLSCVKNYSRCLISIVDLFTAKYML